MNLYKAIAQLKPALRDSHLAIISIDHQHLELRGHNRNNLAILPTLMYGALPLVGIFYFWRKKGAELIVGLCALLFTMVLVVRVLSIVNTKKSYILYDHAEGQLSFRNAEVKYQGIRTSGIESVGSSVTLITNSRYPHKNWYVANVDLFASEGTKYTVAQFEAETPYAPTKQAQVLGQLLAAYLTRPFEHSEKIVVA
ncbi:MAG: hypothetical protein KA408_00160 [Flavobacteriales bacterium]|nr:hypothetical protein [Flavobacteriales bacterium]